MEKLIPKQRLKVKGFIVDANSRLNRVFKSFDSFNNEFSPGNRLINMFSSCFLFYSSDRKSAEIRKTYLHKPNEMLMYMFMISLLSKLSTML